MEALWGAFIIESGGPVYFLADAGYAAHLSADIVNRFDTPRLSLLPVGGYEPQWFMRYAQMTPAEVMQTFLALGQRRAMADEAYDAPRRDLGQALQAARADPARFLLPRVGEAFTVPPR